MKTEALISGEPVAKALEKMNGFYIEFRRDLLHQSEWIVWISQAYVWV